MRILRRAGNKAWPRLYQNLRSSRETELDHYAQVTEERFKKASRAGAAQNTAQHATVSPSTGSKENRKGKSEVLAAQSNAVLCDASRSVQMTPTGFEPVSRP
jgi:hypothetical protein